MPPMLRPRKQPTGYAIFAKGVILEETRRAIVHIGGYYQEKACAEEGAVIAELSSDGINKPGYFNELDKGKHKNWSFLGGY